MKKELQEKLFSNYPELFRQKDLPMSETCMCWGIDCGDGWYDLIDTVCNFIDFHMKENKKWTPKIEFVQVKEKFGGLRMYYHTIIMKEEEFENSDLKKWYKNYEDYRAVMNNGSCMINGAINLALLISQTICEFCGQKATKRTSGWIHNLCEECYQKEMERQGQSD